MEDMMSGLLRQRRRLVRLIHELDEELVMNPQNEETSKVINDEIDELNTIYSNCMTKIKMEYNNFKHMGVVWNPSEELLKELNTLPNTQVKIALHKHPNIPPL